MGSCCCTERVAPTQVTASPLFADSAAEQNGANSGGGAVATASSNSNSTGSNLRRNPDDPLFLVMQTTGLTGQMSSTNLGGATPTSALLPQVPAARLASLQSNERRSSVDSGSARRWSTPARPSSAFQPVMGSQHFTATTSGGESSKQGVPGTWWHPEEREGGAGAADDLEGLIIENPLSLPVAAAASDAQRSHRDDVNDAARTMMAQFYGISSAELEASRGRTMPNFSALSPTPSATSVEESRK